MPDDGINRKLTAILSADVAGYTRLMAENEVEALQRLKAYRELIRIRVEEHHGRVVDNPGDNILAELPSALDAVRCAVEIQRALHDRNTALSADRRMEFRIGIHLGDVMVDGDRIYGAGVNMAARLEEISEPAGICVSEMIHYQVKSKLHIEFEDMGKQKAKNIQDPVQVYKILDSTLNVGLSREPSASQSSKPSIAVLPFEDHLPISCGQLRQDKWV